MATKKSKPRGPRDKEVLAISGVLKILTRLPHASRLVVVDFASGRVLRMQEEEEAAKAQQVPIPFPMEAECSERYS